MPSFIDRNTGEVVWIPGAPWSTDPAYYDDAIATVWRLAGDIISVEDAVSWQSYYLKLKRKYAVVSA